MMTIGLLAGMGELPFAIAEGARSLDYRIFAVGLDPLVDKKLETVVDEFKIVNVGKLGSIINTLKKASIKEVVMGGKVPKTLLYKHFVIPDLRALSLLLKLKNKKDDTILQAVLNEFTKEGITVKEITDFTSELLTSEGVLTKRKASKEEKIDINFGLAIAKEMGRLDIGQTVVIKEQAVMAIEAIEGTDMAIKRGGELGGEGCVVVKVSKPNQDRRFDFPVVGMDTLHSMKEAKARVLALEAEATLMVNSKQMIEEANRSGITIVGIKTDQV